MATASLYRPKESENSPEPKKQQQVYKASSPSTNTLSVFFSYSGTPAILQRTPIPVTSIYIVVRLSYIEKTYFDFLYQPGWSNHDAALLLLQIAPNDVNHYRQS